MLLPKSWQKSLTSFMPTATAKKRAQTKKRQGKAASTQAGEFVRSEMRQLKLGKGSAKSRKQAVAIGLSEARQAGIKVKGQPRSKRQAKSRKSTTSKKKK
jgi:hypothetical protein